MNFLIQRCLFLVALLVGVGTFYLKLLRINLVDLRHLIRERQIFLPVFYNLFVNASSDRPRVFTLVHQQLSPLDPKQHQLRITSIGAFKNISELELDPLLSQMAVFFHVNSSGEERTLHQLWSFCRSSNPSHVVSYLHSKGSFHRKKGQKEWREYLTAGVLSEECLSLRSSGAQECNVCSSRMSPLPHPHTPGNMWTARCDYVSKLLDPLLFPLKMQRWKDQTGPKLEIWQGLNCTVKKATTRQSCLGLGRYALEHWLYSHPDVLPCDLDPSINWMWGPPNSSQAQAMMAFIKKPKVLQPAPRFDLATYKDFGSRCCKFGLNMGQRLDEYEFLYQLRPPPTWWGWDFLEPGS
eukprot:Skav204020  [mRNA]  locus=scaffold229:34736:35791:+ [translate_table: standard]